MSGAESEVTPVATFRHGVVRMKVAGDGSVLLSCTGWVKTNSGIGIAPCSWTSEPGYKIPPGICSARTIAVGVRLTTLATAHITATRHLRRPRGNQV
jgi:hypothetical protein